MSNNNRSNQNNMAAERALTPSMASKTQISPITADDSDRGTPVSAPAQRQGITPQALTTPLSSVVSHELVQASSDVQSGDAGNTVPDFKPTRFLMETEITLEYGKKLKQHRIIHKELLCCYSKLFRILFSQADALLSMYSTANGMRKQLKTYIYPHVSIEDFEKKHGEKKVMPIIIRIYEYYPNLTYCKDDNQVGSYRQDVREVIDEAIADQVAKKNVIAPTSKLGLQKKDLKGMGIQLRVQSLQARGVLNVAQRLFDELRQIKQEEKEAAETERLKAAAQRRIILPNVEDRVAKSLVHWVYNHGALTYDDAEHLYSLCALASELGIIVLVEQCVSSLSADTEGFIDDAFSRGMTLHQVLVPNPAPDAEEEIIAESAKNVVEVVFGHVLRDAVSPKQLLNLVISTLAEYLDASLLAELKPTMNREIALSLIDRMLVLRSAKSELTQDSRFRSASASMGDNKAFLTFNE